MLPRPPLLALAAALLALRPATALSPPAALRRAPRLRSLPSHLSPSRVSPSLASRLRAVEGDFDPDALAASAAAAQSGSPRALLAALYKFTRPHTIRGTVLASVAGTVRALVDTPGALASAQWSVMLPRAALGMVALLLGNAFIVGINQIFDVELDRINKPFLPVASGEMSPRNAWAAVLAAGTLGPLLVYHFFPPLLFKLYMLGWTLGAAYSVPPFHTKRNFVTAGATIAVVRGFLLNFGIYYAVKDAIGAPFRWSPKVAFVARFMTCFAAVIAVTKDLPDTEGDKKYKIDTLATRLGVPVVAKWATAALLANYVGAVWQGLQAAQGTFNLWPMVGGHAALGGLLAVRFRRLVRAEFNMRDVKLYYKHIWDNFYLEYVLYTLI